MKQPGVRDSRRHDKQRPRLRQCCWLEAEKRRPPENPTAQT